MQASLKPKQPGGPPIWMAGDSEAPVARAAKLADAWMPSPMVSEEGVKKLGALFRETRAAAGLPPAKEFPIIRECHVGSGTGKALDEVREPLSFKYEAYASWGGASGFVPGDRIRADFDKFAANRFIIGSQDEVVADLGGALDRNLDVARHPDRRTAGLLRLEARRHAAHGVEAAAMLDDVVAPQLADQLDALDEARHALLERHADRGEFLLAIAKAETDDRLAAGHPVERRATPPPRSPD